MARERADGEVARRSSGPLAARLDQQERERRVLERGSIEGDSSIAGGAGARAGGAAGDGATHGARSARSSFGPNKAQLEGDDAFRFRHLLIRDAAYEALPSVRAELHEGFADWPRARGASWTWIVGYRPRQVVAPPTSSRCRRTMAERAG